MALSSCSSPFSTLSLGDFEQGIDFKATLTYSSCAYSPPMSTDKSQSEPAVRCRSKLFFVGTIISQSRSITQYIHSYLMFRAGAPHAPLFFHIYVLTLIVTSYSCRVGWWIRIVGLWTFYNLSTYEYI